LCEIILNLKFKPEIKSVLN